MTKFWRKKVILFKTEATYGTDALPTGAVNAVRAKNVRLSPMEGTDVDLGHEVPWLGNQGSVPADLHVTLSFEVDLVGSGTAGQAPAFGPMLLACGCAETIDAGTSVTYNPVSSDMDAGTAYINIDGILFTSVGMRGTCDVVVNASGVPVLQFNFTGLYVPPSDSAAPVSDTSAWPDPKVASHQNTPVFTIDGTPHVMRSFKLSQANEVEPRFLIGKEEVVISDRAEMIECQIEATTLAVFNPYNLAQAQAKVPLVLQHEATAGRISTLSVPAAQVQRPDAPTEAQGIMESPLRFKPQPTFGNDQWTLTFT
ncbi:MAG: phage tail tube protein [Pelagimonas sp.]|uniref:phage tail tube protein n=1 Tax=Pelagimonas sp. TaxID=2073170 RepID=UPI003D6B13DB